MYECAGCHRWLPQDDLIRHAWREPKGAVEWSGSTSLLCARCLAVHQREPDDD
jgi:hypothetical protein